MFWDIKIAEMFGQRELELTDLIWPMNEAAIREALKTLDLNSLSRHMTNAVGADDNIRYTFNPNFI